MPPIEENPNRLFELERALSAAQNENERLSAEKTGLLDRMAHELAEAEDRIRGEFINERENLARELAIQTEEISRLRARLSEAEATAKRMESTLDVLDETNSRLKFELQSVIEGNAVRPAPGTLLRARDILVETLRSQSAHSITILCVDAAGSETFDFCIEMRSILEYAGWSVKFMKSSFENGQFYGMQVVNDGTEPSAGAAKIICGALEKAGLAFVQRAAPVTSNVSALRLIVGRSNWKA